mmetsp:Transcript_49633/g.105475  ORF Transcript_49633/g.105475 Transcript_49633/m.105475 type:complete len:223 (-) Transcript_49633:974-1642(-)
MPGSPASWSASDRSARRRNHSLHSTTSDRAPSLLRPQNSSEDGNRRRFLAPFAVILAPIAPRPSAAVRARVGPSLSARTSFGEAGLDFTSRATEAAYMLLAPSFATSEGVKYLLVNSSFPIRQYSSSASIAPRSVHHFSDTMFWYGSSVARYLCLDERASKTAPGVADSAMSRSSDRDGIPSDRIVIPPCSFAAFPLSRTSSTIIAPSPFGTATGSASAISR